MAVHLIETGFTQPIHLLREVGESIGRIVLYPSDLAAETLVQLRGSRAHEIEICEDSSRREKGMDFSKELSLAPIFEMVDRQPRDDGIKGTHISQ